MDAQETSLCDDLKSAYQPLIVMIEHYGSSMQSLRKDTEVPDLCAVMENVTPGYCDLFTLIILFYLYV